MMGDLHNPTLTGAETTEILPAADRPDQIEVLCILNANGVIRFATPATSQFFGYVHDELIGRSALRFIAPDYQAAVTARWQEYQNDPTLETDNMLMQLITATGRRIPIRATVWRLPDNNDSLLVLHVVEHLQDRLETLYAILNSVADKLAIDPMLDEVQRHLQRLIPAEVYTVFLHTDGDMAHIRQWDLDSTRDFTAPIADLPDFATTRIMQETGKPVLIHDTEDDPRWFWPPDYPQDRMIRSWIGAPLFHHGQYLGELNLHSPHPNAFTAEDAELTQALASQIATVIFHARQLEEAQRQTTRYRVLNDISQAISQLDLRSVLELVYRQISELMDTSTFFIGLHDPEAEIVQLVGAYDSGYPIPDAAQGEDKGLTGLVLRTCEPLIISDSAVEPLPSESIIEGELSRSLLMMPLITQDQTVGVISVQSYEPNAYTLEDIGILETVAGAIATAVHNAQLYDQAVARFSTLITLHDMILDLATVQEPHAIARLVTTAAMSLFQPLQVQLRLYTDTGGTDTIWRATGDPAQARLEQRAAGAPNALTEQVQLTGQPVLITDMSFDTSLQREFGTPWLVQAAAVYPIQRSGQLFAVLNLLYGVPSFFRRDMLTTLDMLAMQAATSFQNARYLDTLRRQLHEVTGLQELARQVSALRSLDEVLATTVQTLRDIHQCKAAWIALLDDDQGAGAPDAANENATATLSVRALAGQSAIDQPDFKLNLAEHITGHVVRTGEAIYVPDTQVGTNFSIIDPTVRSIMVVPLTIQGRALGVVGIDSDQPEAFAESHKRVLNIAGGQIAATIETLHLLAEARQQADNLAEANQVLHEQDDLRRELVYQVSHDLRSPLQIVYGYADMLRAAELGPVTPMQTDVLELMLKRTRSIEKMTRDIMAAKPIDRDGLELAEIDLNQLCQQAMVDVTMLSEDRDNLDFQIALAPGNLIILADYNRLSRVLDNLLGNAVKFSPDGGTITLRTKCADDGRALVTISDQGIGIPADKVPFIFERFFRAQRKRFKGSGLGLFIVQQIVKAHNGEVWVESDEGQGSTFTVALPLTTKSAHDST